MKRVILMKLYGQGDACEEKPVGNALTGCRGAWWGLMGLVVVGLGGKRKPVACELVDNHAAALRYKAVDLLGSASKVPMFGQ